MANISHKTLTGSQLHEPKGADTATQYQLYASNGAGSGTWTKLNHNHLTTTGNSFGAQLFHVREQQSSDQNSLSTTGSWATKVLNTSVTNEISGASLATNQLTLPAGTYYCTGTTIAQLNASRTVQIRLRNVTGSATLVLGLMARNQAGSTQTLATLGISGRFTLGGASTVELQYHCNGAIAGSTYYNTGEANVFTDLMIWKIA